VTPASAPRAVDGVGGDCVALLYRSGKPRARAWSGIPAGLAAGLAELGLESCFVDAEPPAIVTATSKAVSLVVRRNAHAGELSREIREARKLVARIRARRSSIRAVIQMGSDFGMPISGPLATYDDQTVALLRTVYPIDAAVGRAIVESWLCAQASTYETAARCCAMSSWAADSIVRDYGVSPTKVLVVGAGRNHEPRPVDRDWSRPRFLFVGNDWRRKNGPVVLEAFARLRAQGVGATLEIAGGHPRVDLEGVTAHGRLDFTRPRERRRTESLFESATCFVMPSVSEAFGIAYVEAAAAGVPSIGTTVGGARDAVGDGGLLVAPNDVGALYEAMLAMSKPERASALGAVALRRAALFTWRAVAERIAFALDLLRDPPECPDLRTAIVTTQRPEA
jgi:glycosyltransferase involved in cell wall biosynthesis